MLEEVVREGFMLALPPVMAEWVMCHRSTSLEAAINLAEDHMALPPRTRDEDGKVPSPHLRRCPVHWRPPSGIRVGLPGCTRLPVTGPKPLPTSAHQPPWGLLVGLSPRTPTTSPSDASAGAAGFREQSDPDSPIRVAHRARPCERRHG